MIISKHYRQILTMALSGLICLNLVAMPSSAGVFEKSEGTPVEGLPGRRLGGGTRGPDLSSDDEYKLLVALVPETNVAVTTAAYPSFLFHLPSAAESREIEYVLRNEADELVYETRFSVDSISGLVSIDLANVEGLAPLVINENYHWYFSIIADDRSQDISVDGWTRRVDLSTWIAEQTDMPDLATRLDTAKPLEQARLLYQEAQLWNDAALILADLKQAEPQNEAITAEWLDLLQTVNLAELMPVSMDRVPTVTTVN